MHACVQVVPRLRYICRQEGFLTIQDAALTKIADMGVLCRVGGCGWVWVGGWVFGGGRIRVWDMSMCVCACRITRVCLSKGKENSRLQKWGSWVKREGRHPEAQA